MHREHFPLKQEKSIFIRLSWPAGTVHPIRSTMPVTSPSRMDGNPYRHQEAVGKRGCVPHPADGIRCSSSHPMHRAGPILIMAIHRYLRIFTPT